MTKQEMRGIWELMGSYRPGDKRLTDKALMQAWWAALEPYEPEVVRQAVAEHFRHHRFWPDLDELALPQLGRAGQVAVGAEEMATLGKDWEQLRRRRAEAGIPETIGAAQGAGMSWQTWYAACEAAGLTL